MGCKQSKPTQTRPTLAVQNTKKTTSSPTGKPFVLSNESFEVPVGCEVGQVKSIPSGDHVLLEDGRTVSLLGVTAPKLESNQSSYAKESQELLQFLCPSGSKVYMEADENQGTAGGNVERYLYVPDKSSQGSTNYKLVNYEVLRSGLAKYDNGDSEEKPLKYKNDLLRAMREGRLSGMGLWKNFDATGTVYSLKHAKEFHCEQCEVLTNEMHLIEYTVGDAIDEGLTACKICKAEASNTSAQ